MNLDRNPMRSVVTFGTRIPPKALTTRLKILSLLGPGLLDTPMWSVLGFRAPHLGDASPLKSTLLCVCVFLLFSLWLLEPKAEPRRPRWPRRPPRSQRAPPRCSSTTAARRSTRRRWPPPAAVLSGSGVRAESRWVWGLGVGEANPERELLSLIRGMLGMLGPPKKEARYVCDRMRRDRYITLHNDTNTNSKQ